LKKTPRINYKDFIHTNARAVQILRGKQRATKIQKAIVALHIIKFKNSEISELIDVSESAVQKYLYRVMGK
jgi:DNA-directed RNA polymerase specialized sigma24 family protein